MPTSPATSPAAQASELLLLLALATLWGASYSFIKIGVQTIPPVTLIAARTLIAGALLLAVIAWRRVPLPGDAASWRRFLTQACLNSVLPFTLIAWAQQYTDAALATVLNSTSPIFAFALTALHGGHQAVTGRKLLGVGLGMAGVCLVVGVPAFAGLGHHLPAQFALLIASACYAGAALYGKSFQDLPPVLPAAGSMICGAAILVPASLVFDRPWTLHPSSESIVALLCLSMFSTALAFLIYFRLVRTLGPVGTTAQAYLRVPIGVGIAVGLLGEQLSTTSALGLACVVLGVAAMTVPGRN